MMGTRIAKLNISTEQQQSLTAERQVRTILSRMKLQPQGMPEEAILCVRHFQDPLPNTLPSNPYERRAIRTWEQSATTALTKLYQAAYQPVKQAVPMSAQAVLFNHPGEWLLCLTRDWLAGRLVVHWWWQNWLEAKPQLEVVAQAWQQHTVHVPYVIQRLTRSERVTLVRQLSDVMIVRITQQILSVFGVSSQIMGDNLYQQATIAANDTEESTKIKKTQPAILFDTVPTAITNVLDVSSVVTAFPELTDTALGRVKLRFLIIVMTLTYRPRWIRRHDFPMVVQHTIEHITQTIAVQSAPDNKQSSTASDEPEHKAQTPSSKPMLKQLDTLPSDTRSDTSSAETLLSDPVSNSTKSIQVSPEQRVDAVSSVSEDLNNAIQTEFGGLFYIINIVLHLGIYTNFQHPREVGLALSIWDFLAHLGDDWFAQKFREDTLWTWLAQMSDRRIEQPPGHDIPAPMTWQITERALRAFAQPSVLTWSIHGERLLLWHPAGFFLVDVPVTDDPQTQLANFITAYSWAFTVEHDTTLMATNDTGWTRWFVHFNQYLIARLQRALPTVTPTSLLPSICQHPATIRWTATHVDIHMKLEEIDLAIRQAGLDRNPGWIPSAAHFITFYFD